MDSEDEKEEMAICEHCGNIVPKRCINKNTLICIWCYGAFMKVYKR